MSDQYPEGKLNENDEGATQIALGIDNGNVVLIFTKPITWIGGDPDWADQLADAIKEKAQMARDLKTH